MALQNLEQAAERARDMFVGPGRDFASLNIDFMEKVADMQLKAAKQYTDIGVKHAKSMLQVTDAQSAQDYFKEQAELASTLGKQVQEDTQQLLGIGQDYAQRAREVAQSQVKSATNAAQTAA